MKVYKHRIFANWAKNETIDNEALKKAIDEIEQGLFEANLGGNLYKKRIARKGQGKSGGYRSIIAFKQDDKAIFLMGFAKSERENLNDKELVAFKKLSHDYLLLSKQQINEYIKVGKLIEV